MLVVGNLRRWRRTGRELPQLAGFSFCGFRDLSPERLAVIAPDVVLSPLVGEDFDVTDLARLLHDCGFTGRYRAVASQLPAPDVVLREVRGVAPCLDFDIFTTGDIGLAVD